MKSSVHTNVVDFKSQKLTVIMNFMKSWIIFHQTRPSNSNELHSSQSTCSTCQTNNCTIQEHVCTSDHGLPYTHFPCILVKYLVTEAATKLIFFPNKHRVSKYFGLWMILTQENIDYECHYKHALGDYVQQAHMMTTTTKILQHHACLIFCIFVPPPANRRVMNSYNSRHIVSSRDTKSLQYQ